MEFSFEILHPIYDELNDEVDVYVEIPSHQTNYHVTFVTFTRAREIFKEHPIAIFSNTLFVEQLTEENINEALKYAITEGFYISVFYPINEQARIALFRKLELEKKVDL